MIYHYFVAFTFSTTDGRSGTANMESVLNRPIDSIDALTAISAKVKEDNNMYETVVVTNFQELKRRPATTGPAQ